MICRKIKEITEKGEINHMNKKIETKDILAIGIGTSLFVILTTVQIPIGIPNTYLQPRIAIIAFLAAVFGPVVGAASGVIGHILGDIIFYGFVWWSWVIPEAVLGIGIGLFSTKLAAREGFFTSARKILLFNLVQIVTNAIAWILVAPILDIVIYSEPVNRSFVQGMFAFLGDIIVTGLLGTVLLIVYSTLMRNSEESHTEK